MEFEQGYEGQKYKSNEYDLDGQKFNVNYFFTPFKKIRCEFRMERSKELTQSSLC